MFELLIRISNLTLPVYVFCTMFNVGLTQKPVRIVAYYSEWRFFVRMLFANFVLVPLGMRFLLSFVDFAQPLQTGLMIFSLTAGAPFLIKLTQNTLHDMALGASLLLLLIAGTIVFVPLLLPLFVPGIEMNTGKMAFVLLKSLVLPIIAGMILASLLPTVARKIVPLVGITGNVTLYILLASTLGGYYPQLREIIGAGAILVGLIFIVLSFGIGFVQTGSRDTNALQDIGALGTAQRNTAASMLIAVSNFSHQPHVLLIITVANTLGLLILLGFARLLSKNNRFRDALTDKKMVHGKPRHTT